VLGIVLLAPNLRPVLTGLTPLIGQIKADTGISYGGAGLLMALSLLAMGCSRPSRRCWPGGLECVLLVSMLVFAAGILLRSVGPLTAMFLGTAVLGRGSRSATCSCPAWSNGSSRNASAS
jgi:MFS transporter, CP family, cyanate transporter